MSENTVQKPKLEHIALTKDSSKKINAWIEQVNVRKRGIKISRKQFVNWLIEKMPETLGSSDLTLLIEKFFDEQKLLRLLLRESNKARAEGRRDTGFEIVVKTKKPESRSESSSDIFISDLEKTPKN